MQSAIHYFPTCFDDRPQQADVESVSIRPVLEISAVIYSFEFLKELQ